MTLVCKLQLGRDAFTLDVDFEIPQSGFTAIVGPSGSGKTTLLRCIAGLERAERGEVVFQGQAWQSSTAFVPTHARPIGYVFQEASLFAHLDVRRNLEFGQARVAAGARRFELQDVARRLGLEGLLARSTGDLSGGERQRVAMARALLASPSLLLMDEPLSSLDAESREQIMPYLASLHASFGVPVVYVTHAQREVAQMAERVICLSAGRVVAQGAVNAVLTDAALPFRHADDAAAAIDAEVVEHEPEFHLTQLALGPARLTVARRDVAVGTRLRVVVSARDVAISVSAPERAHVLNSLAARIVGIHEEGEPAHRMLVLDVEGQRMLSRVTYKTVHELGLHAGQRVFAHIKSVALTHALPRTPA